MGCWKGEFQYVVAIGLVSRRTINLVRSTSHKSNLRIIEAKRPFDLVVGCLFAYFEYIVAKRRPMPAVYEIGIREYKGLGRVKADCYDIQGIF